MVEQKPDLDDVLVHFGVKGMKWGVRKSDYPGASRGTNREASKDAAEFARAKMFYGEGAGTRRKLIKATVEAKAKRDPTYKAAFDHHLANQDFSQHAQKARKERHRKDVTSSSVKTVRGVHRQLTGGLGTVTMASAAIAGAYTYAKQTGADKVILKAASRSYKDLKNNADYLLNGKRFLKNLGIYD